MINEPALTRIVLARLGVARPSQLVQCVDMRWQCMRWKSSSKRDASKGRWTKLGKLLTVKPEGDQYANNDEDNARTWLREMPRRVQRRVAVLVDTLDGAKAYIKDSCRADFDEVARLCRVLDRDDANVEARYCAGSRIAALLGAGVNIKSTGEGRDAQWFVYEHCGMPRQFKRERGRRTEKLTTDDEALLTCFAKTQDARVMHCLKLRSLLTEAVSLRAGTDNDGRIRCGYNRVGTETDRLACYESPSGSGFNLQTVTKKHRYLFKADEGCVMAQCDLKGADGWTVAAHSAALGDTTMLDDYRAGLKPAKNIALLHLHGTSINARTRDELRELHRTVDEDGWHYFTCKRAQHAGSYLVGELTMSGQILSDSYKMSGVPTYVEPSVCRDILHKGFFVRYPGVLRWQDSVAAMLIARGELRSPCGFKRVFYGRKKEKRSTGWRVNHATLGEALAHEPQVTTTNCTMDALLRCWHDPENHTSDGNLIVEPLHTVHDSGNFQCRIEHTEFMRRKLYEWFDNEICIAGTKLVIPFSGTIGADWGMRDAQPV